MFMASKYEEIYPLKLQIVKEKISHNKITKEQIKDKEREICEVLCFKLGGTTIYEFLQLYLQELKLKQCLNSKCFNYL